MTFYIYDFSEYSGVLELCTADYETELSVDLNDTWDPVEGCWCVDMGREKVEKAVSAAFPGSTIEWCPVPIEYDLQAISEALRA